MPQNFNSPYKATDIADFWRRWHISLSTFLRDYLYIPLGGSHGSRLRTYRNLMITMLLGGLWHGAGWTFVVWGAYHGVLLSLNRMAGRYWEQVPLWPRRAVTFVLVVIGFVVFRSDTIGMAATLLGHMFSWHAGSDIVGARRARAGADRRGRDRARRAQHLRDAIPVAGPSGRRCGGAHRGLPLRALRIAAGAVPLFPVLA